MSAPKHTLGPWSPYCYEGACYFEGVKRDGWSINGPDVVPDYENPLFNEADARLIAAAPDLLEALREVFSLDASLIRDIYGSEFVDRARAAIAKATGEAA